MLRDLLPLCALSLVLAFGAALIAQGEQAPAKNAEAPALTETQKLRAEVMRLTIELAVSRRDLATCQVQTLALPASTLEAEFLKTLQAQPGQSFDWSTLALKAAPAAPAPPRP